MRGRSASRNNIHTDDKFRTSNLNKNMKSRYNGNMKVEHNQSGPLNEILEVLKDLRACISLVCEKLNVVID